MSSIFDSPNPILFGCGLSALTGEKLKELGCKKVLVVYDQGVKAAGIVDKVLGYIKDAGIEMVIYDKVEPDPPDYSVEEAGALGVSENVDGIVAIGGGSSLDTAKGARVLLSNPPPINQYSVYLPPAADMSNLKPLVVLPTTAGTGSEATPGGIITNTELGFKYPILCLVSLAIIDPELTIGLPPGITASTGFDALCHSVEAITSRDPNRISELLAVESVRLIAKYLPVACRDGSNMEAREAMSLAASLGGISLRGPNGGIPHDIGKFIGIKYHVAHGTAVGCLLAETMKFIAPVVPDKLRIIAECMGISVSADATPEELGEILCDAFRKLYKEINMPPMSSFVTSREDLLADVDHLYKGTSYTPRELTSADVAEIVSKSYDYN